MYVIAGPSGSGKTKTMGPDLWQRQGIHYFNVDNRCGVLNGSMQGIPAAVRRQAQQECEQFVADHIATGVSFAVETTLRSDAALRQGQTARAAGFTTRMVYFATDNPDRHVGRVQVRAATGLHSAPAAEIREIYAASLARLPTAIAVFATVSCVDTAEYGAKGKPVAEFADGRLQWCCPDPPAWLTAALAASRPPK